MDADMADITDMADMASPGDPQSDLARLARVPILFRPAPTVLPVSTVRFERFTRHTPEGLMPLGAFSYSNSVLRPCARVGRYCSIGANVRVMGASHPVDWASTNPIFYRPRQRRLYGLPPADLPNFEFRVAPVRIGDDVWIGQDTLLAGGISVGTGSVIAAGAVVTRDVPPYSVIGGTPAREIRPRFAPEIVERLLALAWWRFHVADLDGLDVTDPAAFLDRLAARLAAGALTEMPERRRTLAEHLAEAGL